MSLGKYEYINLFQLHNHFGSGEFRQVGGTRFTSRVPGADPEAPLLQRHRRRVLRREGEVVADGVRVI